VRPSARFRVFQAPGLTTRLSVAYATISSRGPTAVDHPDDLVPVRPSAENRCGTLHPEYLLPDRTERSKYGLATLP
jgi:hypothetical protein